MDRNEAQIEYEKEKRKLKRELKKKKWIEAHAPEVLEYIALLMVPQVTGDYKKAMESKDHR